MKDNKNTKKINAMFVKLKLIAMQLYALYAAGYNKLTLTILIK